MDRAVVAFDITQLGAIIADMVITCLDAGALAHPEETPNEQDHRSASVAAGLHLHPAVNAGPGARPPGEYRPSVQPDAQSAFARLGRGPERWLAEFGQGDKWKVCLKA